MRLGIGLGLSQQRRGSGFPASAALQVRGTGVTLSAIGADGMFTVTTDGTAQSDRAIASIAPITGDLLMEIEVIAHANGAFFGFDIQDNAGTVGYTSIDESLFPDAGYGAGKVSVTKAGSFSAGQNIAFTQRIYLERVGTALRLRTGASWAAAKVAPALYTDTAVDTLPRYFFMGGPLPANGQWKVRFVAHPGG